MKILGIPVATPLAPEVVKEERVEVIVQEIIKEEHIETIVQEITKPEHTQTIVQEVLKPENTTVIVEQVLDEVHGLLVVTLDSGTASHNTAEIFSHVENGGTVLLKVPFDPNNPDSAKAEYIPLHTLVNDFAMFLTVNVIDENVYQEKYYVNADGSFTLEETTLEVGEGGSTVTPGATHAQAAQIQANAEAIADIQDPVVSGTTAVSGNTYTITMPRESGAVDTLVVEFDGNGYVSKVTENGRAIPWTTTGV